MGLKMVDNFKINSNIPWVVRLYTIWKPIYKKDNDNYILEYIEFLVFIHSILDSNGNEIDKDYIDYIEVISEGNQTDDFTLKLPEVAFEDGKGGKDIKKFKMNNISIEDYDAEVWNLNENLINKTSCAYKQYYTYANFVDDLYGINGDMTHNEYDQKIKKRKSAIKNSLLFKIHLKGIAIEANYRYDANDNKYKETGNKYNNTNKKTVYAVASNPFFLPSILFDERSNENQVYSFFNTDEHNITKAFICSHDVNAHADYYFNINKPVEFNYYYSKNRKEEDIKNYNYVYAVKSLYSSGNIKLELCSPFEWGGSTKFNIYSRYKNCPSENYADNDIKFENLIGNTKFPEGFNIMIPSAKQIVCYHNGVEDNNSSNNIDIGNISHYDVSYIVNDKTNLIKKNSFKKRFCREEVSDYDSTKYIDCGQRKSEINFGTVTWDWKKYNTLVKLKYETDPNNQSIPNDNKPIGIEKVYNNGWFFGDESDKKKPCILFYGMYKVESIL